LNESSKRPDNKSPAFLFYIILHWNWNAAADINITFKAAQHAGKKKEIRQRWISRKLQQLPYLVRKLCLRTEVVKLCFGNTVPPSKAWK
jgi:hypothetical protein